MSGEVATYPVNHKQRLAYKYLFDEKKKYIAYGGAAGGGKMLNINSLVCTPFGFRPLRELKVGDIITNPNGGNQNIIWIHPKGEFEFYRVNFCDGTSVECSEGHLWKAHQSRQRPKRMLRHGEERRDKIYETSEMYEWYQRKAKGVNEGRYLIIPLTEPVQFTKSYKVNPKTINPYVLGALIGNGCFSLSRGTIEFVSMDEHTVQRFMEVGYDMSKWTQKHDNKAKQYFVQGLDLYAKLEKLGLIGHKAASKFIPECYKYSTIEERKQLMQGLMDTDGYVDSRGHMSYTTISKQLAEDVAFVVRSLGGKATITCGEAGYRNDEGEYVRCNDAYTVTFNTKMNPDLVSLPRKKERCVSVFNGGNSELGKRIVSIEKIGRQESFCISVSDPSGLYCTDDFTVTHNSHLGCEWLMFMCLKFPGTRWFIGRRDLTSTRQSVVVTFAKVGMLNHVTEYKNTDTGFRFDNGSEIILIDLKYMPVYDPMYERLGSKEYTGGWIEEAGEVHHLAFEVLKSRIGRHMNREYGIPPKMLITCNPKKNWVYTEFYEPAKKGELPEESAFIQALHSDNPYLTDEYRKNLEEIKDEKTRNRLLLGMWEYDDDPSALMDYDAICDLFTNEHIQDVGGKSGSADIAGKGHDRFVGGSWHGNVCRIKIDEEYSPGKQVETQIKNMMIADGIPRSLMVVDADGTGSFLESYLTGIKEFHGGGRPRDPRYLNLRSECYFKLAEMVNRRQLRVICTEEQKVRIIQELQAVKQKDIDSDTSKKAVIPKEEMKELLGHSPDYIDMLMMAMMFRLNLGRDKPATARNTHLRME